MTKNLGLIILFCFLSHSFLMAQQARYSETRMQLPTYMFSDPDPVPVFGTIYPYFRFDGYTAQAKAKEWTMIELENDYIKLWITPEIGGKIWGAIEKSTGREFIYFNHAVKFRDIAMRGPWTSGGLEINFGLIGHAPTCATPVDYLLRSNEDGSVSCFLGAIDLPSRTRWSVEVRLPADGSYFITRSKWDNASPMEQSYYHWMNVGVKTAGNLEYVYPGKNYLGHDGQASSWPIDDLGRKLNWYDKNDFGSYKSYHVFGSYTDFFGGYWHDDDFGFGHYSRYDDKPGKKIWIWGLSPQGMIWEELLTDTDGQYTEIQSGRLFNQEAPASAFTPFKHRDFSPATTDLFDEYWFPVQGTKGLIYGGPDASFNLTRKDNKLVLSICPNSHKDVMVDIRSGSRTIFTKQIRFEPQSVIHFSVDSDLQPGECTVWMNGKRVFDGNPEIHHTLRPTASPADMDWNSAYGHFLQGRELERQRLYQEAQAEYEKCLKIEDSFMPALGRMAYLFYRRAQYERSREFALNALAIDTYDGTANYYHGLSSLAMGDTINALDGFSLATVSPDYRSAAYNALAAIHLTRMDFAGAIAAAHKSLHYNAKGSRARHIEILALRLSGADEPAEQKRLNLEEEDPLDHFARIEKYLARPTLENAGTVQKYITNEFPEQTFLEYAIEYFSLGQVSAAKQILEIAPVSVLTDYWLFWLAELNGDHDESARYLDRALEGDPALVFPYRPESKAVLTRALAAGNHWKTSYYLGLLAYANLDVEKTTGHLEACEDKPDFYPFYITRAQLRKKNDPAAALNDLQLALHHGENQWQTAWRVADIYDELGKSDRALGIAEKSFNKYPDNYYLGLQYAGYLNRAGKYETSVDVLNNLIVLPNEGATRGREVWRNSHLNIAVNYFEGGRYDDAIRSAENAREFPKNLGVGRTYVTDERLENFIMALCYFRLDQPRQAAEFEDKIIATATKRNEEIAWNSTDLISAMLLRQRNLEAQAQEVIDQLAEKIPDDPVVQWCQAVFRSDFESAGRIAETVSAQTRDKSFGLLLRLYNKSGSFRNK